MNEGVAGAHISIPLQCECCWMRNLEGRDPTEEDAMYVRCIRRANLDAMAGKASSTIESHRRIVDQVVKLCERINKTPSFEPRGPMPLSDPVGMGLAVEMLTKSVFAKGRIRDTIQFDTMRGVRSPYSKAYESSPRGVAEGSTFAKGTGRVRPTACPGQSEFMQDFLRGAEYRMGFDSEADHGVRMAAIVRTLELIREDADNCDDEITANDLYKVGAFICLVTAASLRGYEGFYLDLVGVREHLDQGRVGQIPPNITHTSVISEEEATNLPHVAVCLLGNFKGEGGINYHIINVANETMSGLQPRWWMEKLVSVAENEGRYVGPAFATASGKLASSCDYDAVFRMYLKKVQATTDFIPDDVNVDVYYSLSRTPRKSALTRARRANIGTKHLDAMNRWRTVETAQGRRSRFNMRQHYSEACLLMPTTWFYSYAL